MSDSCKLKSYLYYRNPKLEIAQAIWNTPEKGAIREISKIVRF